MKAGIYFTGSGPILVLTSFDRLDHEELIDRLRAKGLRKFVAFEVPVEVVRNKYGNHFKTIMGDLHQQDDLRVLDYNGHRVFEKFVLGELGHPIFHEPLQ